MIKVEIITIGDELLIGQVIDTNSAWIAQKLNKIGFDVVYKTTIGDVESDIFDAFSRAFSRADVILVTGGIGPTKDDITKKTLCKYFDTRLVFDEATLHNLEIVLQGINRPINDLTKAQAYVPESATIIQNKMGTAPVTWFEKGGKFLVSMPGVPYEMKWVMENEIIPRLKNSFPSHDSIQHQSFWIKNYSESLLAIKLEAFEDQLPNYIKLAYLPTSGLIRLRLTGKSDDKELLSQEMSTQKANLYSLLGVDIVSEEDELLEVTLGKLLMEKSLTLGLAESCTGGKIASLFTAIPGSSAYFKGGVVSYANEVKESVLGVDSRLIEKFGAVSREVVEQMALGARKLLNVDCVIAISGIAGPSGGTPEKPVGTVWIAVINKDKLISELFHFSQSRENNILRAANASIRILLEMM